VPSLHSFAEVTWQQPYPDRLLDDIAPSDTEPDAVVAARETIELAFIAAIQLLSPWQRAVLILRDVLNWSASETASVLDTTITAVDSALQRARATLDKQPPSHRSKLSTANLSEEERDLVQRFIAAHERGDAAGLAALMRKDVRATMPPKPAVL
jgi:hypothetical protein